MVQIIPKTTKAMAPAVGFSQKQEVAAPVVDLGKFTPEQMDLITRVVAPGATRDELRLFLYRCDSLGLDPLKPGQIHFIKYGNNPGSVVVGIEGFRARAVRTGKLQGIKRGAIKDEKGKLIGAWAEVSRKDWSNVAREEVPLDEYSTGKSSWAKMPETMIKKCAEAAALRMAFPDDLGGVYEQAELDRQIEIDNNTPPSITPGEPGEFDGVPGWRSDNIAWGQWKGRSFDWVYENLGPKRMADYVERLEGNGKAASDTDCAVFVADCSTYLGKKEIEATKPKADEDDVPKDWEREPGSDG